MRRLIGLLVFVTAIAVVAWRLDAPPERVAQPSATAESPAPDRTRPPTPRPADEADSAAVDVAVVDLQGDPLPHVEVEARSSTTTGRTTTDADGRADLVGLPPGRYAVRAWSAGRATTVRETVDLPAGARVALTLVSEAEHTLAVRVVDDDGNPVRDVQVRVFDEFGDGEFDCDVAARTDATGLCTLRGLHGGPHTVQVDPAFQEWLMTPVVLPCDDEVLLVARRPARLVGTIRDATTGALVAGASVGFAHVMMSRGALPDVAAVSRSDGTYALTHEHESRTLDVHLVAWSPGYRLAWVEAPIAPPSPGHEQTLDIRLVPTGAVEVTVVGPDGPVADVEFDTEFRSGFVTDHAGRCILDTLHPGPHTLSPGRPWSGFEPSEIVVPESGRSEVTLRVTGPPLLDVMGLVRDADGQPVAGAVVKPEHAAAVLSDEEGRFACRVPDTGSDYAFDVRSPGGRQKRVHVRSEDVRGGRVELRLDRIVEAHGRLVDATGRPLRDVRLVALPDGTGSERTVPVSPDARFRVSVSTAHAFALAFDVSGPRTPPTRLEVARPRGAPADLGDIVVPTVEPITVHVRDGAGQPVAGAAVQASRRQFRTDDAGNADVLVWEEEFELEVNAIGFLPLQVAELPADATLVLTRRRDVTGRLLLDDGTPPEGALVTLVDDDFGETRARTDATGAFVWRDVRISTGNVQIEPGGHDGPQPSWEFQPVDVRPGVTLSLRARRGARVTGIVLDTDGEGVADVVVTISPERTGLESGRTRSDDTGRFVLEGQPRDEELRADAFASGLTRQVRFRVDGLATEIRIESLREATTRGRVAFPDGYVIDGERLKASPIPPLPEGAVHLSFNVPVASDGTFEVPGIEGVRYRLALNRPHRLAPELGPDSIVTAGSEGVVLHATRGRSIRGRIVDGAGNGVEGLPVTEKAPRNDGPGRVRTRTRADGTFDLSGFGPDAGAVTLLIGHGPHLRAFDVLPDTSGLRFVMDREARVSFTFRGIPTPDHDVWLRGPAGLVPTEEHEGTFVADWLDPTATYDVEIWFVDAEEWRAVGTLRAGQTDVVIDVR